MSERVEGCSRKNPAVLGYVRREYRCADCDAHSKPQPPRKAAIPRTYEFNRIIALDVLYIPLRGQSPPVLNIIRRGTICQVAALMRQDGSPTAAVVRSTFQGSAHQMTRLRTAAPSFAETLLNPENTLAFCRLSLTLTLVGRMGSARDTGHWSRTFWQRGLETAVVFTPHDLEDLLAEIVSLKNRRENRGDSLHVSSSLARIQEFHTSCCPTT